MESLTQVWALGEQLRAEGDGPPRARPRFVPGGCQVLGTGGAGGSGFSAGALNLCCEAGCL